MRAALAVRDLTTVMRLLQSRHRMSQRAIADRTGQAQSEIAEILNGRRVISYDVLVRIAEGLGIPRGYLGLAYHPAGLTASHTLPAGPARSARPSPPAQRVELPNRWWEQPELCAAMAEHDFATVFAFLRHHRVRPVDIAAATGMSLSDVHSITARRSVLDSYRVMAALCDWLGIPRGHVGLAFAYPEPAGRHDGRPLSPLVWTGLHARALRTACRLPLTAFARLVGVSARTIIKWEAQGEATVPRPGHQQRLDQILHRLGNDARAVYLRLVDRARTGAGSTGTHAHDSESTRTCRRCTERTVYRRWTAQRPARCGEMGGTVSVTLSAHESPLATARLNAAKLLARALT